MALRAIWTMAALVHWIMRPTVLILREGEDARAADGIKKPRRMRGLKV